jgi:hypothetical protein
MMMKPLTVLASLIALITVARAASPLTGNEVKALAIVYADFQLFEGTRDLDIYKVSNKAEGDTFRIEFVPPPPRMWTKKGKTTDTVTLDPGPGRYISYVVATKTWRIIKRMRSRDNL